MAADAERPGPGPEELASSLRDSEERFRLLAEAVPVGVYSFGPDRRLRYANAEFRRIFGADSVGRVDDEWFELIAEDDRDRLARAHRALWETGEPLKCDYRVERPDGTSVIVEARARPLSAADGSLLGVVGAAADVTELRALQRDVERGRRMESVGRCAGEVAHGFGNHLSALAVQSQLARDELARGVPVAEVVRRMDRMQEIIQDASRLTRQLLTIASEREVRPEVVRVNRAVTGAAQMLEELVAPEVSLQVDPGADPDAVVIDRSQLGQVLLDLVLNAKDAMPEGGRIGLATRTASAHVRGNDPHVCLVVDDEGQGMSEQVMDHIFEPFFTTKDHGSGLGLSSTYGIVTQAGGFIDVRSTPGRGTTFELYFPAAPGEA